MVRKCYSTLPLLRKSLRNKGTAERADLATVHRQAFSELKMPYDTVVVADLECEVSAKSVTGTKYEGTVT